VIIRVNSVEGQASSRGELVHNAHKTTIELCDPKMLKRGREQGSLIENSKEEEQ
jgi:hypothetical protein